MSNTYRIRPYAMTFVIAVLAAANFSPAQNTLSPKWEELAAPDLVIAIHKAQNTCLLPIGIMESHAAHLPIGTDLYIARYVSLHAVEQDYAVVFPPYYFGETYESLQQPGDVAYTAPVQMQLLQETTDEMARNGCKKIIIVNAHGSNNHLLSYFVQLQLSKPRDYVVYNLRYPTMMAAPGRGSHADSEETSLMMVIRPDLVHPERANELSGSNMNRLQLPRGLETAVNPFANHPDHYDGNGSLATKSLGEADLKIYIDDVVNTIHFVKADQQSLKLQDEYYEKATHPLDTKPYLQPAKTP